LNQCWMPPPLEHPGSQQENTPQDSTQITWVHVNPSKRADRSVMIKSDARSPVQPVLRPVVGSEHLLTETLVRSECEAHGGASLRCCCCCCCELVSDRSSMTAGI
jgi:hypothetical protein